MSHTKGKWEWWTSCSWKRLGSVDDSGDQVFVLLPCIASDGHPLLEVSEDDMALIASAPDLLEALEGYLQAVKTFGDAMNDGVNVQGAMSGLIGWEVRAKETIDKARGNS